MPDRMRRRIEEIFGDEVRVTEDERGDAGSADEREDPTEAWLKENRPPHHGG